MRALIHGWALAAALLAQGPQPQPCDLGTEAARFVESLQAFRDGEAEAQDALFASAQHLAQSCARSDPLATARFYASLSPDERQAGRRAEARFDALQERAATAQDSAERQRLVEELTLFLQEAATLADPVPAAHAESLTARLLVRDLELDGDLTVSTERPIALGRSAVERFERAGQIVPQLEPLWVLGRASLLDRDFDAAESWHADLAEAASRVGRDTWRERALLGMISIARSLGDPLGAEEALAELATFRQPGTCWALAREKAVQLLSEDEAQRGLEWLERYPPSLDDPEIDPAEAERDWRSLVAAAHLRSGRPELAAALTSAANDASPFAALSEASAWLEAGSAEDALARAEAIDPTASPLVAAERHAIMGRAYLDLGQVRRAIDSLEAAIDVVHRQEGQERAQSDARRSTTSSRMGEWLGLSAIGSLSEAYVEGGDPLAAAAVIAHAHSPGLDRVTCERMILAIAARGAHGYVGWIAGANACLAIHVEQGGTARAHRIPHRRRDMVRAIERFRGALLEGREGRLQAGGQQDWVKLAGELAEVLLPPSFVRSLRTSGEGAATLGLHGVLERLPAEALLPFYPAGEIDGGRALEPLGCTAALTVTTSLHSESGDDPASGAASTPWAWTALGAPASTSYPGLPGAAAEIEGLRGLDARTRVFLGDAFTESRLRAALGGTRALHVATHVVGGPEAPALLTSEGRTLGLDEVRALGPRLPLVYLSACGSAEGSAIDGLSVRGLAQVMLESGTRCAVVSLWPIGDRSAERASLRTHAALLGGMSPEESVRRARVFLRSLGAPAAEWAAYRVLR